MNKTDPAEKPAFPQFGFTDGNNNFSSENCGGTGITMRDFFAAHALSGLIAQGPVASEQSAAEAAYRFADEMMNSREG